MNSFTDFNIPDWLKESLTEMGYTAPTPIQEQSIPLILEGKDVLGSAQTGTGKTGAFLIPLMTYLHNNPTATALILTPTRELAMQVNTVALQMLKTHKNIKTALLIGGDSISKQFFQLKYNPRLIVGTPGRINDHISRNSVKLNKTSFIVLDETDRMLDMGFGIQIDEILKYVAEKRQTLLFSATLPKEILRLVNNYLVDPARISAGNVNTVAQNVTQECIETSNKEKDLLNLLATIDKATLIFVRTQIGAENLKEILRKNSYKADCIHGGLRQNRRSSVISSFRSQKFNILVATDVASRGLDINHISYVINYDIPDNPEDYVHRIGRTARGNNAGASYSFVSPSDRLKWRAVQRFLDPKAPQEKHSEAEGRKFGSNNRSSNSKYKKTPFGFSNNKGYLPKKPRDNDGQSFFTDRNSGNNKEHSPRKPRDNDGQSFFTARNSSNSKEYFPRKPKDNDGQSFFTARSSSNSKEHSPKKPRDNDGKSFFSEKPYKKQYDKKSSTPANNTDYKSAEGKSYDAKKVSTEKTRNILSIFSNK